jgi:Helicase conserved C-terminal domain
MQAIRTQDATAKALIFSQFASTLRYLQRELPRHGFSFRTLTGDMSRAARTKALEDFRADPPTTIFLLSVRSGACGINLTSGMHFVVQFVLASTAGRSAHGCWTVNWRLACARAVTDAYASAT